MRKRVIKEEKEMLAKIHKWEKNQNYAEEIEKRRKENEEWKRRTSEIREKITHLSQWIENISKKTDENKENKNVLKMLKNL